MKIPSHQSDNACAGLPVYEFPYLARTNVKSDHETGKRFLTLNPMAQPGFYCSHPIVVLLLHIASQFHADESSSQLCLQVNDSTLGLA